MKKRGYLAFIVLLFGFFFIMPTLSFACQTKSEKICCKKEASSKTNQIECCKNKESKQKDNSCGGKCGHSNCTASAVNFSILPFFEVEFKNNTIDWFVEKPKFHNSKTIITSGFTSVWLPPKIK